MKTFDLRKIYRTLKYGDIQKVANAAGVKASVVTRCLSKGWHPDLRNSIVAAAMNVIRDKGENPELVKEAEAMKLTADTFTVATQKPLHRFQKGNTYGRKKSNSGNILLYGVVAVGAFLLLGGTKLFKQQ
jgi:hypothetical protein